MTESKHLPNEHSPDTARIIKQIVLRVVRNRWREMGFCLVVAIAVAVGVALQFTAKRWESKATLLYSPLPVPEEFREVYTPPKLSALIPLVTSRSVLEQLQEQYDIPIPLRSLGKLVGVESPKGAAKMLEISFEWGDPKETAEMVNCIVNSFRKKVARIRKDSLNGYFAELDDYHRQCKTRLTAARKRLQDFSHQENVVDADEDLDDLREDIAFLESALLKARREEKNGKAQLEQLTKHIDSLKQQDKETAKKTKQYQASQESITDSRRRQDRLRELIGDERRVMAVQAQLEVKRREYERAVTLAEKKLIPQSKLERIQGEMETLIARIKENESILKWKKELKRIDETVVPKGAKKQSGSPIITQVLFRKLELELKVLALQEEIFQLQKSVQTKRTQRKRLTKKRHEFAALQDDVSAISDARRATEDRLAVLRKLKSLGSVEFNVVSPAKPEKYPAGSNRKILLAGTFVVTIGLLGMLILALELFRNGLLTTEDRLILLSLPRLGRVDLASPAEAADSAAKPRSGLLTTRRLALAIRQAVRQPGALVLFSSLADRDRSSELMAALAECFARRDERVLLCAVDGTDHLFDDLIDAEAVQEAQRMLTFQPDESAVAGQATSSEQVSVEPVNKSWPGLTDLLSFVAVDLSEAVLPATIPGVDCLLPGQSEMLREGFATHRMNELLFQLREKYSIILLHGPPVSNGDDLLILSAVATGILFTVSTDGKIVKQAAAVISEMRELQVPVIGAAVLE